MKDHLVKLKQELEAGSALLLDVREMHEWDAGHLKDAQFVPLSALKEGIDPDVDKTKTIYLHCRSGGRVRTARPILEGMGYNPVIDLREGFAELDSLGFPRG